MEVEGGRVGLTAQMRLYSLGVSPNLKKWLSLDFMGSFLDRERERNQRIFGAGYLTVPVVHVRL